MTTLGPTLDSTGFFVPSYADVYVQLQNAYLTIFGTDAVLTPNTQDGQFLAIFAQGITDCLNVSLATYNAYSINQAQGAGLSSIVKLTGVRRASTSYSTDIVTITGTANTTISNGQVGDNLGQGTIWNLPATVNIPDTGTIDVTVTNTQPGPAIFDPGQVTQILSPTFGWQSAANIGPATAGAPVQTDAQLRQIASNSVGGPSLTPLESIYAAVATTANVTRFKLFENDTDVNDANGQGPHSIYAVIQGGTGQDIADAIGSTKSPGTSTLGTSQATFVDSRGVPNVIRYYQLASVTVSVVVNLTMLAGYTTNAETLIKQSMAAYITDLDTGVISYLSRLYSPANLSGDAAVDATGLAQLELDAIAASYNVTSILQSRASQGAPAAHNVPIAFNEAATCTIINVTVIAV